MCKLPSQIASCCFCFPFFCWWACCTCTMVLHVHFQLTRCWLFLFCRLPRWNLSCRGRNNLHKCVTLQKLSMLSSQQPVLDDHCLCCRNRCQVGLILGINPASTVWNKMAAAVLNYLERSSPVAGKVAMRMFRSSSAITPLLHLSVIIAWRLISCFDLPHTNSV